MGRGGGGSTDSEAASGRSERTRPHRRSSRVGEAEEVLPPRLPTCVAFSLLSGADLRRLQHVGA